MPTPSEIIVDRPQRWESRFGPEVTEADVDRLLLLPPFRDMDPTKFGKGTPLRGILLNDTRFVSCQHGDVILREGDYGHSAFLILKGQVRVVLKSLPRQLLGRAQQRRQGWLATLWNSLKSPAVPEVRRYGAATLPTPEAAAKPQQIFLQDVPQVLGPDDTVVLGKGEVFGELAALSRTPRSATVLSEGECLLLEIRWQGLAEMRRADAAWRAHVDRLYRENSLRVHLRETPLFANLSADALQELSTATQFASYGKFDWHHKFKTTAQASPNEQIAAEPLIATEGEYADSLLLIRSGFARLSVRCGAGHRTLAYLGKGDVFGLDEILQSQQTTTAVGWRASLRAVGYVDVLRIPRQLVEQHVLPQLPREFVRERLAQLTAELATATATPTSAPATPALPSAMPVAANPTIKSNDQETRLLEFLVDSRLNNGTQTMVIDLDRCTRCDDCVRACAATHDGNPRFNREGPKHGNLMFTQACMHCVDPVCMIGCPTGAIGRDAATGNILINDQTCIGCGTCASSCPYQNIRMVEIRDESGAMFLDAHSVPIQKATKCDLCTGQWGGPACQRACAHDALIRIDLRTPNDLQVWSNA